MKYRVEIYSRSWCGFCRRAKRLLELRDIDYVEHDVEADPARLAEMVERVPGARTVPQILINGRPIGGYTELSGLALAGQLEALLDAQAA